MSKELDISTPEGIRELRRYLKKVTAADALSMIEDHLRATELPNFTRCASGIRVVDGEQRTFDASFSSETPVERYFGIEVLGHKAGEVDLSWMKSGNAPLLWMHNPRDHVGAIPTATHDVDNRRCDMRCRCANDLDGDRYFARVREGIIRNTSVGYSIKDLERTDNPDDEDQPPTYRATRWKPHEASLVSTPADETVGVGRSRMLFRIPDIKSPTTKVLVKTTPTMTAEEIAAENARKAESTRAVNEAIAAATKRVNALHRLRAKYDPEGKIDDDAAFVRLIDDANYGELNYRQHLEEKNATPVRLQPTAEISVTDRPTDMRNYSLVRALRGLVFGEMDDQYVKEDARLRKLSPSVFKPAGKNERSLVIASEAVRSTEWVGYNPRMTRAQNAQNLVAGGALVGITFAPEVIEYLRPMPVLQKAGAVVMSGITGGPGTIRFPKQAGDIYAQWVASQVASNTGQLPFGVLDLTPKRLVAQVRIDRQLLLQESFDIEAYVRNSINLQFALSYDLAGLIGNGNGMPLGILNTPNIQSGAVTFNGPSASSGTLAPQFLNFTQFITKVLSANAGGLGRRSYITSPQSMMNWATVPKAAQGTSITNAAFMLELTGEQDGEQTRSVLGERVYDTTYLNTLPTGYTAAGFTLATPDVVLYGPFNQYMFIEWAGTEWIYDPYTQAAEDLIVLTARLYVDGGCRQPTAFVTSSNAGSVPYVF